jgi:secreted PhoX family phosphatase
MVAADGTVMSAHDPYDFTNRGGRYAADELNGTPYGRPEDLTVNTLANGNEAVYWATTSENIVYYVDLGTNMVGEYVNSHVTPDLVGNNPVGQGSSDSDYGLDDPDNLAADAAGNIFIIEDENPGDVFMAVDADKDGMAESVSLFASLGKYGSEPTGFKVDPRDPLTWYVNIQHPSAHGNNDALWVIKHDIADMCGCESARNHGQYVRCVAKSAKTLGIQGDIKDALMEVAAKSSCGK